MKPSPTAKIEAATDDGPNQRLPLKSQLRPDGSFTVAGDAGKVMILVTDRERRLSGFTRVGPDATAIDLELTAGAGFDGVLLDHADQPLASKTVRLLVGDTDILAAADQLSDAEGRFHFDFVPSNVKLEFRVRHQSEGQAYFHHIEKLLFLPKEERQNARVEVDLRSDEERQAAPMVARPLSEQLARALRNARLSGMHTLVVMRTEPSNLGTRLAESLSDYHEQRDVLFYTLLFVDQEMIESNAAVLQELAWPLPGAGGAALVALDAQGKQLGSVQLAASDASGADKLAAAFLKQHKPEVRDAHVRLAAARDEAKRTNRRIWLVEGGRAADRASACHAGWRTNTLFWKRIM